MLPKPIDEVAELDMTATKKSTVARALVWVRRTLNRDATALIVAFVLGIVLGAAVEDSWGSMKVGELLPALATLFAAFLGATFAFALNKQKDAEEKRRRDLAAGNRAIFTMIRQINKLVLVQRQVINPHRGNPAALIEMPPMEGLDAEQIRVDIDSLDFLLEHGHGDLLGEIAVTQSKYHGAIDGLKQRARIHISEAQPRFERVPTVPGGHTLASMREVVLGQRIFETLRQSTEQAIILVDSSLEHLKITANQLTANLKAMFPGSKVVSFIIPEPESSPDASHTTTMQR